MSSTAGTVADTRPGLGDAATGSSRRWRLPRSRRRPLTITATRENGLLFAFFLAFYTLVGYFVTVRLLAIPFDATARLAHAYFVLYGDPAKLAAIGFVWPPVPTLVDIPFAAIKPVATSLVSLPLSTAFFAAGLLVVLNRLFTLVGMRWFARYPLVLAFALNPFFAHYAMNGMAEMVYLFFLVLALHYFVKWHMDRASHHLAICGLAMAMAVLSRYEMSAYAVVLFVAIALLLYARRASEAEAEGALILYAAPIAYSLMLWVFFNWLIMGDPLYFLDEQVRQRFTEEIHETVQGPGKLLAMVAELNWRLFAPTLIAVPVLLAVAWVKRNLMTLILAALVLLNPAITAFLIVRAHEVSLLQPRFNMRSMPIVMIAVGWLFYMLRGRWTRVALVAGATVAIVASYPLTWNLMGHYKYRFAERFFVRAIETGKSQNPAEVGVPQARSMADYINSHITKEHSILTDDAQSFLPMLLSGRPELFFDRIDRGDTIWLRAVRHPVGHYEWVLISDPEDSVDLILKQYPTAPEGGVPFLRRQFTAGKFLLFKVVRPPPTRHSGEDWASGAR